MTQLGHLPSRRVYRQTGLSPIKNWTEAIRCQLPNLMATMRRRNFLGVLGGAAAWPLPTRAQQTALPVVGLLGGTSAASSATPLASFREGLRDAGYIEGQNDNRGPKGGGPIGCSAAAGCRAEPPAGGHHGSRQSPVVFCAREA